MEIRIGIINTGRELSFETASSADEVRAPVSYTHLTLPTILLV